MPLQLANDPISVAMSPPKIHEIKLSSHPTSVICKVLGVVDCAVSITIDRSFPSGEVYLPPHTHRDRDRERERERERTPATGAAVAWRHTRYHRIQCGRCGG